MTIITQATNPAEIVPEIFFNHTGAEAWGGKHVSALSGVDVISILEFCQREGQRQGWNDAQKNKIGDREDGPFDRNLLIGFPSVEWKSSYLFGVKLYQNDCELF